MSDAAVAQRRRGVFSRLYRGETAFDFVGRKRWWFTLSAIVIAAGAISLGVRGLNFGVDFLGGTSWQVPTSTVTVTQTKNALAPLGLGSATIESLGTGTHRTLEVQYRLAGTATDQSKLLNSVTDKIASLAHVTPSTVSITSVGPTWGGSITRKAVEALIVFFFVIAAYIALRFEWKMAVAALVAVVHDLAVTVGIYSLSGFQVTPSTVVAVLTILGYSLYDTIVVFDRVIDNARGMTAQGRLTYSDTVNLSMNQVLMRSVNTSIVAILPILSVLVIGGQLLGAQTLQQFGLALFIGLTTGAYSSIFIASPLLAILKERESRYRQLRLRLEARGEVGLLLTPAAVALGGSTRRGSERASRQAPSNGERNERAGESQEPDSAVGLLEPASAGRDRASAPTDRNGAGKQQGRSQARPPSRPATSKRAAPRSRKRGKRR